MNKMGDCASNMRFFFANSRVSRTSFTPDCTAESEYMVRFSAPDNKVASVVLPTPGGPQSIQDGKCPASIAFRKGALGPTTFSWPMYSSNVVGRIRSARGCIMFRSYVNFVK